MRGNLQVPSNPRLMQGVCSLSMLSCYTLYWSETVVWREKERFRIRVVQMDNLRSLLGISKMDRVSNAWIREFCGVAKEVDERILRW